MNILWLLSYLTTASSAANPSLYGATGLASKDRNFNVSCLRSLYRQYFVGGTGR